MAKRKSQAPGKLQAFEDAIHQAEQDAGQDDGSAGYAVYRAAMVGQAIQAFYNGRFNVRVYAKGSGYGVVMTPVKRVNYGVHELENDQIDDNAPDF